MPTAGPKPRSDEADNRKPSHGEADRHAAGGVAEADVVGAGLQGDRAKHPVGGEDVVGGLWAG